MFFSESFNSEMIQKNFELWKNFKNQYFFLAIIIFYFVRLFFAIVSIPGSGVLTILGGALFGFWVGVVLTSLSVSLGVLIVFLLTRYALRDFFKERFDKQFKKIDEISKKHGANLLLILRLIEIVPSFIINSFFSFTPMKSITYFWVSFLGMMPGIILFTNAGSQITDIQNFSDGVSSKLIISFSALILIPFFSGMLFKHFKKKNYFNK